MYEEYDNSGAQMEADVDEIYGGSLFDDSDDESHDDDE